MKLRLISKDNYVGLYTIFIFFAFGCQSTPNQDMSIHLLDNNLNVIKESLPDHYIHNSAKNNSDYYLLKLEKKSSGTCVLEFDNSHTDNLYIYNLSNGEKTNLSETGDLVPYVDRDIRHRNILIPISNQDSIIVNVVNRGAYLIPVSVKSYLDYLHFDFVRSTWIGGCAGIIVMLLLITLSALIFSGGHKMIWYYFLFGLFSFLFFITELGFGDIYLWPHHPEFEEPLIFFFILGSIISLLLLVFRVFHLDEGERYWLDIQKILLAGSFLFLIALFVGVIRYDWIFEWFYDGLLFLVVVVFLFVVIAGIMATKRKVNYAFYFLFALSIMIMGSLIKPLALAGLVGYNGFVQYGGIVGLMINLIALAGLFLVRYFEGLNESIKMQNQIVKLERSALQAQMNPHFIFNSLNSIQNYIAKNDQIKAMDYLSGFAKLVRRILNASSEKKITLEEEISMLEGYLNLEKLRFKEKFEYNIHIPADIDTHQIRIPPLLIQPFVENAVIHGLKNKKGKGIISINFYATAPFLKVVIEDNGVGIGEISKSSHKSKGMSITQKRLEHLNKSKNELAIRLENKKDLGRSDSGTIVTLMINTA